MTRMQGTLRGVDVVGAPAFEVIAGGYGAAIGRPLASFSVRQEIIA
ncbi:MAG: hypothetical protein RL254_549, partial [Planctomycetota bacterium]